MGDFLTGRMQHEVINSAFSDVAPVTSGVEQESVLGLILFPSFINDMPDSIICREVRSLRDCIQLPEDLDSLECWEKTWKMCLNPTKSNIIQISKRNEPTPRIELSHQRQVK